MLSCISLDAWKINQFFLARDPTNVQRETAVRILDLGKFIAWKVKSEWAKPGKLEQSIYLNVQNFCTEGRDIRSILTKMPHNSISVLWWEKATELTKKREWHFNRLILFFLKHHYLEEGHGSQQALLTVEMPLLIWISSRCPVASRQLTSHCNQYQTSKRSGPISEDESEVRGFNLRGGKTGPWEQKGSKCWPSHILQGAGPALMTYLYEQPYLGNQTF